jgi:nucleoside-diphosphate-sugar epimerase
MKILLTGAAGFIGMTTCLRLLERGDEVVGLDNLNNYYEVTLKENRLKRLTSHPNFRFVRMDVADRMGMEHLFSTEKFDRVIHLAAQAGVRYSLENPTPTSTATSSVSSTFWKAAATTRCSIWPMPPAPACTVAIPTCRSPNTKVWTTR